MVAYNIFAKVAIFLQNLVALITALKWSRLQLIFSCGKIFSLHVKSKILNFLTNSFKFWAFYFAIIIIFWPQQKVIIFGHLGGLVSHGSAQSSNKFESWGRGGGQVVSMLTFYSDDPSLNPAEAYSFSSKIVFEKKENKQKDAGLGPLKTITRKFSKFWYFIPTYEPNSFFDWPHPNCLLQKNSMVEKFSSWLFIPFYFYKKPRAHSYTEYFKRHFTLCWF